MIGSKPPEVKKAQRVVLGTLKDVVFRNAAPLPNGGLRKVAAGGGLFLFVKSADSKLWRFLYRWNGKQQTLSLGKYPTISVAEAVRLTHEAKQQLIKGISPSINKRLVKAQRVQSAANSFQTIALEWLSKNKAKWAVSHSSKIENRLTKDIYPYIGKRPISEITAPELLAVMRRIEARGAIETAHRALTECSQIFRYAVAIGAANSDPTRDLRGALTAADTKHHAAIVDADGAANLMRAILSYRGTPEVRTALQLSALLFQRPGEIRAMKWMEVDLQRAEWRYVVSKTKSAHLVPLSLQSVALLRELQPLTGHRAFVFPGVRSPLRPMSENTVRQALRTLGYTNEQMTPHGFRAMARSLLAEMGWKTDAIERQLAHKAAGPLGEAYDRAQFLKERKAMMQAWADYLDVLREERKIVSGNFGRAA